MKLRLGTRGSALARTQSLWVADTLAWAAKRLGITLDVELVVVATAGDTSVGSLADVGSVGVFVTALRESLLSGECDLIVHSLKDMPVAPHPGLEIAAIPAREDPRDAWCAGGIPFADAPKGFVVGTGSPRRTAQLAALRPDFVLVPIRGNVDTRLGLIGDRVDAVVLAAAGLHRLGRADAIDHYFDPHEVVPAPGQGALAVEIAVEGNNALRNLVAAIDDPDTRVAVGAERVALAILEAGCSAPVGALATVGPAGMVLDARVHSLDGRLVLTERGRGLAVDWESIGRTTARMLLGRGAAQLMARR